MRPTTSALACLLGCLALGCENVGAPLVDRTAPSVRGVPKLPCTPAPDCAPMSPDDDPHPRLSATPVDLIACGAQPSTADGCERVPTTDALFDEPSAPVAEADADAGAAPLSDSELEPDLEPCAPELAPVAPQTLDGDTVTCQELALTADGGDHLVTGLTLRDVNLRIRATRSTRLTLDDATLESVFLELEGPIELRVQHARSVDALRAVGTAGGDGRPQLLFADVRATRLHTGTTAQAFDGALGLDQVELQDSQLFAERVDLESVSLAGGRVEAESLNATDAQFSDVTLAVDRAVLSAFAAWTTLVQRCDTLVLIAGRLVGSTLAPCSGPPVRLYDTKLIDGRADGRFESDGTHWERVALGASAATELVAFGGALQSVNFCEHAVRPQLNSDASARCSSCDGWSEASEPPCAVGESGASMQGRINYCPQLDARPFAACPAPVPERDRPLDLPF